MESRFALYETEKYAISQVSEEIRKCEERLRDLHQVRHFMTVDMLKIRGVPETSKVHYELANGMMVVDQTQADPKVDKMQEKKKA